MGLAHVTYWAWKVCDIGLPGSTSAEELGDRGRSFLAESFDSAWRARHHLREREIAWAFATNHCAYVGQLGRLRIDETEECFKVLNGVLRRYRIHYRFADTLALPLTMSAEGKVREYGGIEVFCERGTRTLHKRACSELLEARNLLEKAKPFFGDVEVAEHYGKVLRWLDYLACEVAIGKQKRQTI
jgi:hypothetical protein